MKQEESHEVSVRNPTMPPLLQVRNLAKDFGEAPVFREISFDLHPGGHMALLGPSGCGKSTLLRLLTGLETPSEGEIRIHGTLASEPDRIFLEAHQRRIGMVFQELALWPNLTALENVALGLPRAGQTRRQRHATAREALERCRLGGLDHRKPAQLSVGQQQRVAMARALAPCPDLLLLDEPFTGLDLILKAEIFAEIRRLVTEFHTTLLLVTHDPSEARALATDAFVLEDGVCREHGPLAKLLANPASATLRAFLAAE